VQSMHGLTSLSSLGTVSILFIIFIYPVDASVTDTYSTTLSFKYYANTDCVYYILWSSILLLASILVAGSNANASGTPATSYRTFLC
jgi:hypothetical protein